MTGPRVLIVLSALIVMAILIVALFISVGIGGHWAVIAGLYLFSFFAVAILALFYPTAGSDRPRRRSRSTDSDRADGSASRPRSSSPRRREPQASSKNSSRPQRP